MTVARARLVAHELAPVWWVVRGYAIVAAVAHAARTGWSERLPVIPDPGLLFTLLMAAAIVASVALGMRARRRDVSRGPLAQAAGVVSVVAALIAGGHVAAVARGEYLPEPSVETRVVHREIRPFNGATLDNIHPYDRRGRMLFDVLLYDSKGRPLDIPLGDPNRRLLVDNGAS